MKNYLILIALTSLFSGIQAIRLENVTNNSDQAAYLIGYTPQFTGNYIGNRGEIREERSFYRVNEPILYVIAKKSSLRAEELLDTGDILALVTKKGERFINQSNNNLNIEIRPDGSPILS